MNSEKLENPFNEILVSKFNDTELKTLKEFIQQKYFEFLPITCKLGDFKKNEWEGILKKTISKIDISQKEILISGYYKSDVNIFDLIQDAIGGNENYKKFLEKIEWLSKDILQNINPKLLRKFKPIVHDLLGNFDEKESRYLDKFGELAVIQHILSNKDFTILDIEKRFSNNKSMDLEIEFNGKIFYVEIFSVRFDMQRVNSQEDIKKFLTNRIEKKLLDKLKHLTQEEAANIYFIPVLYNLNDSINQYESIFTNKYFQSLRVLDFYSCLESRLGDKVVSYDFKPISKSIQEIEAYTTLDEDIEQRNG